MIKGLVIYDEIDVEKNKSYINWLIEDGIKYNLDLELILTKDIDYKIVNSKYKFAINRSRDFKITYNLESIGLRVFNKFKFCRLGNDKLEAYNFMETLDIKYPKIYRCIEELNSNKKIIEKPKNGHGGIGINILKYFNSVDFNKNVYQEFIEDYVGDIRFYIINNNIVNSVIRIPKEDNILSNFTRGGEVKLFEYSSLQKEILDKILNNIDIDFGGIDFLLLGNGEILFNEFEDAVGSRMLSHLGVNNTMELFLEHIRNSVKGMK
ncbi:ATP-grasp domain-containing protein [Clostridium sp.]|uniref:ATP-grasp domain-containing protein n=1 Tax=Clostridium sp. TaxID=1506 RepID=UPI0025BD5BA9|nr:ATP-grasp domain-containing protein [Clostridium sp.]